ncbi:MAG: hypothetical protein IPH58_04860 [Sphingobacteriales bacterium]|nr:hypothetical protein [Sphingobacteriales bacterium]
MAIKFDNKSITKKPVKKMGGNIESECLEEVNELSEKLRAEQSTFKDNVDANYFTVVTFNNSKQLDEFLNKLGINPSDKQYIDGKQLAKKLGIEITTPDKKAPGAFKVNSKLVDMVM